MPTAKETRTLIARMLRRTLEGGASVDIDGLGQFLPCKRSGFRFVPRDEPRVFIAYVEEDVGHAKRLYDFFSKAGVQPWLDKKKLLPGQNWPRAIKNAIHTADFFVACFSNRSVLKRGSFHSELRYALQCATRVPLDEIFFIPLRLDDCALPARITRSFQYVDLFPDWDQGASMVVDTMHQEHTRRKVKRSLLPG